MMNNLELLHDFNQYVEVLYDEHLDGICAETPEALIDSSNKILITGGELYKSIPELRKDYFANSISKKLLDFSNPTKNVLIDIFDDAEKLFLNLRFLNTVFLLMDLYEKDSIASHNAMLKADEEEDNESSTKICPVIALAEKFEEFLFWEGNPKLLKNGNYCSDRSNIFSDSTEYTQYILNHLKQKECDYIDSIPPWFNTYEVTKSRDGMNQTLVIKTVSKDIFDSLINRKEEKPSSENINTQANSLTISKEDAAQIMGIKEKTLINMVSEQNKKGKDYPFIKRVKGKSWVIIKDKFEVWLNTQGVGESKPEKKTTKRGRKGLDLKDEFGYE